MSVSRFICALSGHCRRAFPINRALSSHQHKHTRILSIEGNIGSGKTTLFNHLESLIQSETVVFLREPVDLWEAFVDEHTGLTLLQNYYANQSRYSLAFQIMVRITRLQLLEETILNNPSCQVIICERSLESDQEVFVRMLRASDKLNSLEHQVFTALCASQARVELSGVVYLDTPPDVCFERVRGRARAGEEAVSLAYLKTCGRFHEEWIARLRAKQIPILLLDGSGDFRIEGSQRKQVEERVTGFIDSFRHSASPRAT